jgi:hypothetical protein
MVDLWSIYVYTVENPPDIYGIGLNNNMNIINQNKIQSQS